jgi:hypothetical protein
MFSFFVAISCENGVIGAKKEEVHYIKSEKFFPLRYMNMGIKRSIF